MNLIMQTVPYKNPMRTCNAKDTFDGCLIRVPGNRAILIMPMSGTQHLVNHPLFMQALARAAMRKGWRRVVLMRHYGLIVFMNIAQYRKLCVDEKSVGFDDLCAAPTSELNYSAHWRTVDMGVYRY